MSATHSIEAKAPWPVFPFACCALGAMGIAQLWIGGMALGVRFQEAGRSKAAPRAEDGPLVIRVVPPVAAPVAELPSSPALPPLPPPPAPAAEVVPTPLAIPVIGDARAEGLVRGAREARVAGDMGKAVVKLEEALALAPDDLHILFEMGLVHEQLGVFDKAAGYYQKVFDQGVTGAGSLYEQAARKLREGFESPDAMVGNLSLGRVQIFKDPNQSTGERVILTVPVQKNPAESIDAGQISLEVRFFNRTNRGEVVPLEDSCKDWAATRWLGEPVDWEQGEESLRVVYTVPRTSSQDEHLFGTRAYYGQVVILQYGEKIIDVQAWPRELAARINTTNQLPAAEEPGLGLTPEFQDTLPPDFDPAIPLLPKK